MATHYPSEEDLLKLFGKKLASVRKSKELTQARLAELADLSVVMIAYVETGKRWVRLQTLHKIARALDVEVMELFLDV